MTEDKLQNRDFLRTLLNAIPAMILVSDERGDVQMLNRAASETLGFSGEPGFALRKHGEILHCVNSQGGCGHGEACKKCILRGTVAKALEENRQQRRNADMRLQVPGQPERSVNLSISATPFEFAEQRLVLVVLQDITELVQLREIIPICASCKKIRDDENYWHGVETYFKNHASIDFSHGICPDCMKKLYGDLEEREKNGR